MRSFIYSMETGHIFIWLIFMLLLSSGLQPQKEELVQGKKVYRYTPFFAFMIFLPILLMTVFGRPRSDTYAYISSFRAYSIDEMIESVQSAKEPGFVIFNLVIKSIFGNNTTAYRLAMALVQAIPLMVIFRKWSEDYLFTIYLFVANGMHLAWMMNGIRQFMAVTIIFAATPWVLERRYLRSILVVLLAASFHRSALFMLPVVLFIQGEPWNWKTILVSLAIVFSTVFFAGNSAAFDSVAGIVGYSTEAVREWGDDGTNPIRVALSAIPMVLAFFFREQLWVENDGMINLCVNMSVVTTGVNLLAMVTSGILTGRMPIYTSLYNLILLPHLIDKCFDERYRQIIKVAAIVLYFLSFYVQWRVF